MQMHRFGKKSKLLFMKKIALITGYSSDIGQEVAELLSQKIKVIATSRKKLICKEKHNIEIIKLDITNEISCNNLKKFLKKNNYQIDILINIVGHSISGPCDFYDSKTFNNLFNVNVLGAFRLMQLAIPDMKLNNSGRIINIASMNSYFFNPYYSIYCATKAALLAYSYATSVELQKFNIHITTILPGALSSNKNNKSTMTHKSARESFFLLKWFLPLTNPKKIAEKILESIMSSKINPIIIVGRDAKLVYLLQRILPNKIWFNIQKTIWSSQK